MKKTIYTITILTLLLTPLLATLALTSSEGKSVWLSAKQATTTADAAHKQAKIDYAASKTPENEQKVIDTGKTVLNKALDEVEAWLNWKNAEAEEDTRVPDSIKSNIESDVNKNKEKIEGFRTEVAGIDNRLELGVVFLKMIGGYLELLTDVARNTGAMWVHIGNTMLDTSDDYEAKLRDAALKLSNNSDIISALDQAKNDLSNARNNVSSAEKAYKQVVLPGTPLIKFNEGNNYLRTAQSNLLSAQTQLNRAFALINSRGQ